MSTTIRFPYLRARPNTFNERSLIIELLPATGMLYRGGGDVLGKYASLSAWKLDETPPGGKDLAASPFTCAVIEFEGDAAFTIGNGTVPIGLYGAIVDRTVNPITRFKTLIGILGINIAGTNVPVIPLDMQGAGDLVGYSQPVSNVAVYDELSVGGVGADIDLGDNEVIVRARPFIQRNWMG